MPCDADFEWGSFGAKSHCHHHPATAEFFNFELKEGSQRGSWAHIHNFVITMGQLVRDDYGAQVSEVVCDDNGHPFMFVYICFDDGHAQEYGNFYGKRVQIEDEEKEWIDLVLSDDERSRLGIAV